jgi:hypothetical protein
MSLMGVDIAWARPDSSQIRAAGAHFVARYLSPDSSKNLTASEVQSYPADGLSIVVVWESAANRMLDGYAAGVADAQAAEIQRAAVGLPSTMPLYFACDFDAVGSQYHTVNEYMRGVNSVIGLSRSGIYAGYCVVENVFAAPATAAYAWQADAWSNGNWSAHANIRQENGTLFAGGADVDYAETTDYGQYPRPNGTTNGGDDLPTPEQVWAYENGQPKDAYGMLVGIYEAVAAPTLASQIDGAKHTLGEHEVATNANAIKAYADVEALKSDVAELKALLAKVVAKVGA